jgi:hypothetical protein
LHLRASTNRLAAAAVPARANTVHIGRFLSIHSDGFGRSATQAGHVVTAGAALPRVA